MSFADLGLHPSLLNRLGQLGYDRSTPIQRQAIPALLAGRDVLAYARTGAGRTAAFLLPILHHYFAGTAAGTAALILVPTLERALWLEQQLDQYSGRLVQSSVIYGTARIGAPEATRSQDLTVIVATPERLVEYLGRSHFPLAGLKILVLDDADQLLKAGFLSELQQIAAKLPVARQTVLLAEEASEPLSQLSATLQHNAIVSTCQVEAEDHSGIAQRVWPVARHLKSKLLVRLQDEFEPERVLVFVRNRNFVERIAQQLRTQQNRAAGYHSQRARQQRQALTAGFRAGKYRLLVTTHESLGEIDTANVSHVVNYDLPADPDEYFRRLQAAPEAVFFNLVAPNEEEDLINIEFRLGRPVRRDDFSDFDYLAPEPHAERGRSRRAQESKFEWDPEVPRTWGDRNAPRKEPPKVPVDEWEPEPLPDIWFEEKSKEVPAKPDRRKEPRRSRRRSRRRRSAGRAGGAGSKRRSRR